MTIETNDPRPAVREAYAAAAGGAGCCGTSAGCGCSDGLLSIGYTAEQAAVIPEGANLGLGCGNPLAYARLAAGETVLDLGSGAGIDCFLASLDVGSTGHVIGVDMTPAMIEKARENARRSGRTQVEFRLGEIEHLPVADESVDAVISNCVINLSPDKPQVFREAYRVLRPGGRLAVSDIVLDGPLPTEAKDDVALYCGCVGGASSREDYLTMIAEAGFVDVVVMGESDTVGPPDSADGATRAAYEVAKSIKVYATRP